MQKIKYKIDYQYYIQILIRYYDELAISSRDRSHLKKFSMIESPSGWVLSPTYELLNTAIVTLAGKKSKMKPSISCIWEKN